MEEQKCQISLKHIFICVLKMNQSLTGLERHECEFIFVWTNHLTINPSALLSPVEFHFKCIVSTLKKSFSVFHWNLISTQNVNLKLTVVYSIHSFLINKQ